MGTFIYQYWIYLSLVLISIRHCYGARQRFIAEPSDATAATGQIAILRCTVENLVGQVQWLRNGFGLGVGPMFDGFPRYKVDADAARGAFDLIITNIQLEDDAVFECQVGATESTPGLQSRRAKLTVQVPPDSVSIDGGPRVQVVAGSPHVLTCRAPGSRPAATISWRREDETWTEEVAVETVQRPDGKRQDVISRLTVRPSRGDQDRRFTCLASHPGLIAAKWTRVRLDVLYAPEVTLVLTSGESIREYHRLVFTCSAQSNPPVTGWRWYRGETPLANDDSRLVVESVDRTWHGQSVSCVATNSVASTKQSMTVSVLYGPQLETEPLDVAVDLNANEARLACQVDSHPDPVYTWTRVGTSYPVLGRSSTLVISPVVEDSFGIYTCTATVDGYPPIWRNVRLLANGPPKIMSWQQQSARFGDTGTLECAVYAIPKPKYITWTRDGVPLDINALQRYKVSERDVQDGRVGFLIISSVQDEDYGSFNCTTDNGYGYTYLQIELVKKAVVPIQYILGAVLAGLLLVIIVCIVVFVYRRRKSLGSEIGSDSSEYRMTRGKKDPLPDMKIEYSTSGDTVPRPNSVIDTWKTDDIADGRYYNPAAQESAYPYDYNSWNRQPYRPASVHSNPYDPTATYSRQTPTYSVHPKSPLTVDEYRGNDLYAPNIYGSMRGGVGSMRRDVMSPYDFQRLQAVSPSVEINALATNV